MLNKIYIGLGSNLGDSIKIFSESIKKIISDKDFFFHSISSPYISEPIGYTKQSDFFNAVICVKSKLNPHNVLKKLLEIENQFGRTRPFKNSPRTLDLDLLLYENLKVSIKEPPCLVLPHPEIHKRFFVLKPLIEIEPNCYIPGLGKAFKFIKDCENQKVKRLEKKIILTN